MKLNEEAPSKTVEEQGVIIKAVWDAGYKQGLKDGKERRG